MRFVPALAWAAAISWLSSMPDPPGPGPVFPGFDKVVHAGAYALLLALVLYGDRFPRETRRLLGWVVAVAAYGALDEVHQAFVPARQADVLDFVADALGAAVVALTWRAIGGQRAQADRAGLNQR